MNKYEKRFTLDYHANESKEIELDKSLKKDFFYKGPKYDYRNHLPYYDYISKIKNVEVENSLIKIEIENTTYPHTGYAYLDLTKLEITHTEIIN